MGPPIIGLAFFYGAGLWAGLVFLVPLSVVLLGAAVVIAVGIRYRWRGILLGSFALGFGTGAAVSREKKLSCTAQWESGRQSSIILLHDRPGTRGLTSGTVLYDAHGCRGSIVLRMEWNSAPAGSRMIVVGTFRPPRSLRVRHLRVLEERGPLRFRIRDAVRERIRSLYGSRAGLVDALVLGRRHDLDPGLRRVFASAGLAHLLAISGLHVGMIAGWLLLLARLLRMRRAAYVMVAAVTWCYVALLGFPVPATRAALFVALRAASHLRERHPPPSAILAAAVLLLLLVDPSAPTQVGAWLTVAAVWGIIQADRLVGRSSRKSPLMRLLAVSVGANLATAPITAFAFGSVAPVGVLANLIAIPLAGVVVPGVFLSLFCGRIVAGGAGVGLALLERTAEAAARVPGGHLQGDGGFGFALPWLVLLLVVFWLVKRRPSWGVLRIRFLAATAVGTWSLAVLAALPDRESSEGVAIYVIDVGQGDAIAIRTPRDRWVLIDAGPRTAVRDAGRSVVVPFLRRKGVHRLDALIATHGDADHIGGVPAVVRALDPSLVLEPGQPLGSPLYIEHLSVLDAQGIDWRAARTGDTLVVDSVTLVVLHPPEIWTKRQFEQNENSVVVRLVYRGFEALFTGDIGWPAESALIGTVLPSDLLKVGHHGSAGGTSGAWLDAVRPKASVISVGRNNYGHPSPEVLSRLKERRIPVFRTDVGGTVTIMSDGSSFIVRQGRERTFLGRLLCRMVRPLRSGAFCGGQQPVRSRTFSTHP